MRTIISGLCLAIALFAANIATAQVVTTYYTPVVAGYTPAVTDYGFGPAYSPTVTYYSNTAVVPTTTYYAPTVASTVVPTTTYYAPAAAVPVTTYYAPAAAVPVTTYYAPAAVPVTTYYARPSVWVAPPKVYVAGEPIRNFFRAITP